MDLRGQPLERSAGEELVRATAANMSAEPELQ